MSEPTETTAAPTAAVTAADSRLASRRSALLSIGGLGLGAAALSLAGPASLAAPARNVDPAVLNFALNLEYLEAAFYTAAVGRLGELRAIGGDAEIRLPASLSPRGMQFKDSNVQALANEIAQEELEHVRFLHAGLGGAAVARPVLDLNGAFDAAGQAASGGAIKGFNPYASDLFFLHGAFIFEDVGVTAYNGAATLITNPAYLQAAAGILAVEGNHAGAIRYALFQQRYVTAAAGLLVGQVVDAISALRAKVGGGKDEGLDSRTGSVVAPADQNGIAYARTTAEVLSIVYLGGKGQGGFYPNGLNGAIK